MEDVPLINCIKKYPQVYDPSNQDFKNFERKEFFWNKIGEELNADADDCKKRWRTIRERFTRELRRSYLEPDRKSSYVYFDLIEPFLSDHIKHRSLECRGDVIIKKDLSSKSVKTEHSEPYYELQWGELQPPNDEQEDENSTDVLAVHESAYLSAENSRHLSAASDVLEYQEDTVKAGSKRKIDVDENSAFGESIGLELAKLTKLNNIRAKVEIYKVIQKFMELEEG